MRIIVLLIMGLMLIIQAGNSLAEDLPDTLYPWGIYTAPMNPEHRSYMDTILNFNVINLAWNGSTYTQVEAFMDLGMYVYPNRGPVIDTTMQNYYRYTRTYYMHIEAEDRSSAYCFSEDPNGFLWGDFWAYEDSIADTVLTDLDLYQKQYNSTFYEGYVNYYCALRLKIDAFDTLDILDSTDVIVKLYYDVSLTRIDPWDSTYTDSMAIIAGAFSDGSGGYHFDSTMTIELGYFILDYDYTSNASINYTLYSTGKAKVYFDYFMVRCEQGRELIDRHQYEREIKISADTAIALFGENPAGWYIADEPNYWNYRPIAYMDNLIKANDKLQTSNQLLTENKKELYLTKTNIPK